MIMGGHVCFSISFRIISKDFPLKTTLSLMRFLGPIKNIPETKKILHTWGFLGVTKFLDEAIAIWNWTAEYVVYLLHDGAGGGVDNKGNGKRKRNTGIIKLPILGGIKLDANIWRFFEGFPLLKVPWFGLVMTSHDPWNFGGSEVLCGWFFGRVFLCVSKKGGTPKSSIFKDFPL